MRSGIRLTKDPHFAALEKMYLAAPINAFYRPKNEVSDSEASAHRSWSASEAPFGKLRYRAPTPPVRRMGDAMVSCNRVPPENSIGADFREQRRRDSANEIGWQARTAGSRPGSCHGGPGRATKHASPMPFKSG